MEEPRSGAESIREPSKAAPGERTGREKRHRVHGHPFPKEWNRGRLPSGGSEERETNGFGIRGYEDICCDAIEKSIDPRRSAGAQEKESIPSDSEQRLLDACLKTEKIRPVDVGMNFQHNLHDWQAECLSTPGLLEGNTNLVFAAPTSSGKSLVADVVLSRRMQECSETEFCLLVLPFVSTCHEKEMALRDMFKSLNRRVHGLYGTKATRFMLEEGASMVIATIEKANMLINQLITEDSLCKLKCVIVDEIHMISDPERGHKLEMMLTKLMYATRKFGSAFCQILGMSATLSDIQVLAQWLDAATYETSYRPVKLLHMVKIDNRIYNESGCLLRQIPRLGISKDDPDDLIYLCREVIELGSNVLIFCPSKPSCERCASFLAELLLPLRHLDTNTAKEIVEAIRDVPWPIEEALEKLLLKGVAFHHSGLSREERALVECLYKTCKIRVLCATSTLAAGVNLPARRVIFRQPYVGLPSLHLDAAQYHQMSGRAGRTGLDAIGESILLCTNYTTPEKLFSLLRSDCTPLQSCFSVARYGIKHALLEAIAGKRVSKPSEIEAFLGSTLLAATEGISSALEDCAAALRWLREEKFIAWIDPGEWRPTGLGKAAFASSFSPEMALSTLSELMRCRKGIALTVDLHLVYLIAPAEAEFRLNWQIFYDWIYGLSDDEKKVVQLIGVEWNFLERCRKLGNPVQPNTRMHTQLQRCQRLYYAVVLNDLINEVPLEKVATRIKSTKGALQRLQEMACNMASKIEIFCETLGWLDLSRLVAVTKNRIAMGVKADILSLAEIPHVKGYRARLLYNAGLRTPEMIVAIGTVELIAQKLIEAGACHDHSSIAREWRAARLILEGAKELISNKLGLDLSEGKTSISGELNRS